MAVNIQAPRGVRDILPADSYKWQYLEKNMREICRQSGFNEIRTPMFEHTELFLRGVGDTTDVVQKEMYTFEDKGGRSITLRPEGTAGAARAFIEHGLASGPQPTKMFYLGFSVFRYENPQAGRLREHHQFGVELFGAKDASADAEVINLALRTLNKLGVNNLSLNINSIGCPNCRPQYNKRLIEYFEGKKDKLCSVCKERLYKNPLRILDCKEEGCKELSKDAPHMIDCLCPECEEHFSSLKRYLEETGVKYSINPFIVRGLDYYTKTVFEIISNEIGAQGTVCGGGRYDGLIKQVGGPAMPGVGFGMGMERLLMVMDGAGIEIPKPQGCDLFIAAMGEKARFYSFGLVKKLRDNGFYADMDHCARSLKAQLKYADKIGAKKVAIIGEDELDSGVLLLKNMLTDDPEKKQKQVKIDDILNELR